MPRSGHLLLSFAFCSVVTLIGGSQTLPAQQFISATNIIPPSMQTVTNGQGVLFPILGVADFNLDGNLDVLTYNNPASAGGNYALLLGNGHGSFTQKAVQLNRAGTSLLVGDVNGDGKPDIVTVVSSGNDPNGSPNSVNSTINVFLGNGDGTFKALAPVTINSLSASIALLRDLNGDGKLDVITNSVDENQDDFQVFLNDGTGVFHAGSVVNSPNGTYGLGGAGKFYPHSSTDLVMVTGSGLQIFKNDGHANFTAGALVAPASDETVTVGDFNGDGYDDLLVTASPSGGGYSQVLLNHGNGTFTKTASLNTSYFSPQPEFTSPGYVADFNHDGKADLAFFSLAESGEAIAGIFSGNGDGTFGNPVVYNLGSETLGGFAVADFNNDGNLDLLTSTYYGPVNLAFGDKYGSFNAPRVTLSAAAASLATGDFNGDGLPDFVTVNQGTCSSCYKGSLMVFPGTGNGYLGTGKYYPIGQLSGVVAVGDVNGDGKPDIVVTRSSGVLQGAPANAPDDLSVLLGDGNGNFAPAKDYKLLGPPAGGNVSTSVFLADTNHDGKLDLIGDWGVALGNGDGTFKKPIPLPAGITNIVAIGKGDFSQNGSVDLAVASSSDGGTPAYVYTLIGKGDGSFKIADKQEISASSYIGSLTAADLNNDGATYIIFTASTFANSVNSPNLWVERVNPDGSVASTEKYATQTVIARGSTIAVGDFNGDGKPDVLVSDSDANGDLTLWYGAGNGQLSATTEYVQGVMNFVTPVNLNGDDALDVVGVAIWPDNTVVVGSGIERLINTGAR